MKCNSMVVFKEARKRGSGKPYLKPSVRYNEERMERLGKSLKDIEKEGAVYCGGNIEVSVDATLDGGCGCCGYSELEITYKCDRCDELHYPMLPNSGETLSSFLTVMVGRLSELDITQIRQHINKTEETRRELVSDVKPRAKARKIADELNRLSGMCGLEE